MIRKSNSKEVYAMVIRDKRVDQSKKMTQKVKKKMETRHGAKETTMSKITILEKSGLIGCLTGTGVTSTNYKDLLGLRRGKVVKNDKQQHG